MITRENVLSMLAEAGLEVHPLSANEPLPVGGFVEIREAGAAKPEKVFVVIDVPLANTKPVWVLSFAPSDVVVLPSLEDYPIEALRAVLRAAKGQPDASLDTVESKGRCFFAASARLRRSTSARELRRRIIACAVLGSRVRRALKSTVPKEKQRPPRKRKSSSSKK